VKGWEKVKTTINVKILTGFFERTDFKLKITAEGLIFKPITKGRADISISAASVKSVTFYETKLKMETQADVLTDAYFANESDWLEAMSAVKENITAKIICEIN